MMYSNEDLERFYFRFQTEVLPYKKCYMWVLVNKTEKVAIFFYDEGSRGRKVLTDFLGEADLKALMSDGYNAYTFIGNELQVVKNI